MKRPMLVLGAFALVASACGGDDDDASATTITSESSATATSAPDTTEPAAAGDETAEAGAESDDTSSAETTPVETTPVNTADSTEATTPPTEAPSATTAAPTATTAPETDPSETADPATAFDWFAIVEQLLIDLDRISREPSVELVTSACAPDSPCFEDNLNVVNTFLAQGLHLEGGGVTPLVAVEFLNTINDLPIEESIGVGLRVTRLAFDGEPRVLVDENGSVVQELPVRSDIEPGEQYSRFWVIAREAPGEPWRISFIEVNA